MSKRKLFQKLRGIWRKRVLKKKVRSKRRLQTDGLETYNRPIVNRFDEVNQRTPDKSMGELMRKYYLTQQKDVMYWEVYLHIGDSSGKPTAWKK